MLKSGGQNITLEQAYEIENLIFISCEFDQLIKPEKFNSPFLYNIHFSLLPAYKGMYTSALPLYNGEKLKVDFLFNELGELKKSNSQYSICVPAIQNF